MITRILENNITEIAIITQAGPRIYKRGEHFDGVQEQRSATGGTEMILFKNGKQAVFIHENVPIVIEYGEAGPVPVQFDYPSRG